MKDECTMYKLYKSKHELSVCIEKASKINVRDECMYVYRGKLYVAK